MNDVWGVTRSRSGACRSGSFIASETPLFVGRAVAALAADPAVARKGGRVWAAWTLLDEYGFVDADGSRPHWGRHWRATFGPDAGKTLDDGYYAYWAGYNQIFSGGLVVRG